MYLLPKSRIESALHKESSGLQIGAFAPECLQHTFYYFRLGAQIERQGERDAEWHTQSELTNDNPLALGPHECVRVQSLEEFALGRNILGVLGSSTNLALRGIGLLHGPLVDPMFPFPKLAGSLRLALVNHTAHGQTIGVGEQIGKISFYDIGDTYPVTLDDGSAIAEAFRERGSNG